MMSPGSVTPVQIEVQETVQRGCLAEILKVTHPIIETIRRHNAARARPPEVPWGVYALARDEGMALDDRWGVDEDKRADLKAFLEDLNGAIPRDSANFVDLLARCEREPAIATNFRNEIRELRERMKEEMAKQGQANATGA
jgi:hypothetical protein